MQGEDSLGSSFSTNLHGSWLTCFGKKRPWQVFSEDKVDVYIYI